jgi:SpoIID/LytB domain protein
MPVLQKINAVLITTIVFVASLSIPVLTTKTWADDPCKNISDLDDKAECYEEQIEKKEKQYSSTSKQLSEIRSEKDSINKKISELGSQLNVTQSEIDELNAQIAKVQKELESINTNLEDRRTKLGDKITLRNKIIRNYSKRSVLSDLELFLTSTGNANNMNGFQTATYAYIFNKSVSKEMIDLIKLLNSEIGSFEADKNEAETLKGDLDKGVTKMLAIKYDLDNKKQNAQGEFADIASKEDKVEDKLEDIEEDLAELTAKQQAVLNAKSGDFSASLSEGADTDDSRTSASYKPGFSPAFAAFSYGAYTHRNGMSQYGARGRAEDGQKYDKILKFYYKVGVKTQDDLDNKNICITGVGNMKMGEYLKGLGEMPPSWGGDNGAQEALKAQAVAARTYAYRYLKAGKCICTTTSCQYFSSALVNRSDRENWYDAIKDTKNKILDGDVSAQYSSTTGGYVNGVGWDVDGKWPNDAYEKKGDSPWFYKAWFTQSTNKSSSTCGRSSPWLNGEEMADILNAYVLLKANKNTERVLPETINKCPIGGKTGDPYSKSELRSKAKSVDGDTGFEKVSDVVSVSYGTGLTSKVTFKTDKGNYTVDGQTFMKAFNVRAPGYIAIKYSPDSKALFDVLKK